MDELTKQVGGDHYAPKAHCPKCGEGIQHWDYAAGLPYLDAQISKYADRHQQKGGFQDLLKSMTYLVKTMQVYYPTEYAEWKKTSKLDITDVPTVDPDVDVYEALADRHVSTLPNFMGIEGSK